MDRDHAEAWGSPVRVPSIANLVARPRHPARAPLALRGRGDLSPKSLRSGQDRLRFDFRRFRPGSSQRGARPHEGPAAPRSQPASVRELSGTASSSASSSTARQSNVLHRWAGAARVAEREANSPKASRRSVFTRSPAGTKVGAYLAPHAERGQLPIENIPRGARLVTRV